MVTTASTGMGGTDTTLPASFQRTMDTVENTDSSEFSEVVERARKGTGNSSLNQSVIDKKQGPENLSRDEELKKVAEKMEGLFLNMLVKQMRKTVPDSGYVKRSEAEKMFQAQLDKKHAQHMANNTKLGLAETIYEQFTTTDSVESSRNGSTNLNLTAK